MSNIDVRPLNENGKKHGEWIIHRSNGRIKYKLNYINGQENGPYIEYDSDSEIIIIGNFKNSIPFGFWQFPMENQKEFNLCLL